jgi:hypothetical protein
LLKRTLATFLSPEFGFLGFTVNTLKHTPFIDGLLVSCGDALLRAFSPVRHPRRTCMKVALCRVVEEKVRCEETAGVRYKDVGKDLDAAIAGGVRNGTRAVALVLDRYRINVKVILMGADCG